MPLLPMEDFVFPDDLLTAPGEASGERRWWVLHTKPRAEKALARKILDQRIPYFLPLGKRQWKNKGRSFCSYLPLFPGYLFLHGDSEARCRALETNLVANCLPVPDQDQLQGDLLRVYHLMVSGTPLSQESRFGPGTRVEIISGPLEGMEGTVLRQGKQLKFYVEVRFLRQGVAAEVESWMLRPLDTPRHAAASR